MDCRSVGSQSRPGTMLAYTVSTTERDGNGLHMVSIGNWSHRVLDNMRADYARLTWDDSGSALAVLRGMDRRGFAEKENSLITFDKLGAESAGLPENAVDPNKLVVTRIDSDVNENLLSILVKARPHDGPHRYTPVKNGIRRFERCPPRSR